MEENIINLLSENISNQIAAGEVIQRPSSVVKELLENSIDAQSSSIKLILKDSGKSLIQVIDNGIGMNTIDARMCFERHATSKIKTTDDIFNIKTKGFRGEALASIGAISHLELRTKKENSDIGTEIIMEGGEIKKQNFCQTLKGTIFSVKNLFFNTPARRKFLKSDHIEYRHILNEFFRVSMAHPDISFYLENNGETIFNLGISSLKERIEKLIGKRIQDKLIKVEENTDFVKLYGFVANPSTSKKIRGEQFFFANNRFIKNYYLNHAVNNAFSGLIKEGEYPSYFLFLILDPKSIDINIHPTKTEIKFDNEEIIYSIVKSAVKHSIGKFSYNTIDFNSNPELESELSKKSNISYLPEIKINKDFNPFDLEKDYSKKYLQNNKNKENNNSSEILFSQINNSFKNISETYSQSNPISFNIENTNCFQYKNKYIVLFEEDIKIINQRLAHRKILYEQYSKNTEEILSNSSELIFPFVMDINELDKQILLEVKDKLLSCGFDIVINSELSVKSVPLLLKDHDLKDFIHTIINNYYNSDKNIKKFILHSINSFLAEKNSIKPGQKLSKEEMMEISKDLFLLSNAMYDENGNIIYISLTEENLFNKTNLCNNLSNH